MTTGYQVIVVGAGGIGSSATYWLSRRLGRDVACLEQWQPGHDRGASEDHSRIIRMGYHASRYTALTRASYQAWRVLEREAGVTLVHRTGMINLAPQDSDGITILNNYEQAMQAHGIGYERLAASEIMQRWPQFRLEPQVQAIFQAEGGILDIRRAVAANLKRAQLRGAVISPGTRVLSLNETGSGVELTTTAGRFEARHVIICAGAWTAGLLSDALDVRWPIRLTHEQVTYFASARLQDFAPDRFPIWIWHSDREFYGFPVYGQPATKAAEEVCGDHVDIDTWDRKPDRDRIARVGAFVDQILPGYSGPELYTRCCLYDMPPDRDFVIDKVPGHQRITVCIGAGHAAKFAALLGRMLTGLALDGGTTHPISAFRADRPALTDSSHLSSYRFGTDRG